MARPPTTPPTQNGRTEQSTYGNGNGNGNSNSSHHNDNGGLDHSLLQPRVAVALGVPRRWHPFLIVARLLSIAPALWWGIRSALRFLFTEFVLSGALNNGNGNVASAAAAAAAALSEEESRLSRAESSLRLTETLLAMVWCWASAHLAYFFTDCLMSRWLIHYTPQATIVRLFTLACVSSYCTSWVVWLWGASELGHRGGYPGSLLLPAWISIAAILTACYQITQRRVNIRKETRLSLSVFSYASFISMVALLLHSHLHPYSSFSLSFSDDDNNPDYSGSGGSDAAHNHHHHHHAARPRPDIPLFAIARRAADIAVPLFVRLLGVTREMDEL